METYILAACFFTSILANLVLMAGLLAKRQRTSLEFSGQTLHVQMHQGNVHLITGLVLYEKGRHTEAIAMLQEAVRQDPDDRMADAMLQIALNNGGSGVAGLPPGRHVKRLTGRAGADADGIIDAVIQDVVADDAQLAAGETVAAPLLTGATSEMTRPADAEAATPAGAAPASDAAASVQAAIPDGSRTVETPTATAPLSVEAIDVAPAPLAGDVNAPLTMDLLATAEAGLAAAVRQGLTMLRQGEVEPALRHFEALVREHPDSRIARTGQAIALKHAGRADDAAEALRQTLGGSPTAETPTEAGPAAT